MTILECSSASFSHCVQRSAFSVQRFHADTAGALATLKLHDEVRLYLERKSADHAAWRAGLVDRLPDPRAVDGTSYDEASRYALAFGVHHFAFMPIGWTQDRERLFEPGQVV